MRPYKNAYDILFLSRYKVVYNQGRSYLYGTPKRTCACVLKKLSKQNKRKIEKQIKESEQKINKSYPKMVEFHTSLFYL